MKKTILFSTLAFLLTSACSLNQSNRDYVTREEFEELKQQVWSSDSLLGKEIIHNHLYGIAMDSLQQDAIITNGEMTIEAIMKHDDVIRLLAKEVAKLK